MKTNARAAILAMLLALPMAAARAEDAPVPAAADSTGNVRLWTSVFAGRSSLAGDTGKGTQAVTASIISTLFGADTELDRYNLVGASLGISHQTFSAAGGFGGSDDISLTLYARHYLWDGAYIAESLGYGWHDVSTYRSGLGSSYEAAFRAHDIGGRLEGGYTFRLDDRSLLAPYAAFVGDDYAEPAYDETTTAGTPLFAVSYAASTFGVTHLEMGSRYSLGVTLDGMVLSLDAMAGWEHELDGNPLVLASFQVLPGTSFALRGTSPATDTALLGAGARYLDSSGFSIGLRGDSRLGVGTTILSGTLDLTYRW